MACLAGTSCLEQPENSRRIRIGPWQSRRKAAIEALKSTVGKTPQEPSSVLAKLKEEPFSPLLFDEVIYECFFVQGNLRVHALHTATSSHLCGGELFIGG
jgi:hypothetical protein